MRHAAGGKRSTRDVPCFCLPHAQHELTTFGSNFPHEDCHALPAVPLLVHHLCAAYMAHVPYASLKPGVSMHVGALPAPAQYHTR